MKKYILSFTLIIAFTFYVALNNESASYVVAPGASSSSTAQVGGPTSTPQPVVAGGPPVTSGPATGGTSAGGTSSGTTGTSAGGSGSTGGSAGGSGTTQTGSMYKDGTYTGNVANAFYGSLQVAAVIQNGQLADIQFLEYPSDNGHSMQVSRNALPILKQEAIQSQSANVNIVSGATQTSGAFQESLTNALAQAQA